MGSQSYLISILASRDRPLKLKAPLRQPGLRAQWNNNEEDGGALKDGPWGPPSDQTVYGKCRGGIQFDACGIDRQNATKCSAVNPFDLKKC